MATFGPYTQPQQGARFVQPIPLDLIQQGTAFKEGKAQENLRDITQLHNSIFNIPTYGKDKEKLMELEQGLKQQMSQMNLSNLGNMETASQIKNLINQAANNPEVAGIAQRYGTFANEQKKKEEAEAKGKNYYSEILDDATDYFGSGVYKADKRFTGNGALEPEITKLQEDLMKSYKDVIVRKEKKLGADGRIYTTNIVDGEKASEIWQNQIENDPSLQKFYNYRFNKTFKGRNWDIEGQQILLNAAQNSRQLSQMASTPEERAFYAQKAQSQEQAANSKYSGSQMKQLAFQDFIKQDAHEFGNINNALNIEDIDADAFKLENLRTSNNLYEYGEKLKMDDGQYESKGIPAKSSTDKVVYSNTGETTSAGAAYNTLKSAFEGKETGLNDLAPKIAKAKNLEYNPKNMKAVRNEDGTISIYENKRIDPKNLAADAPRSYQEIPNTKTDIDGAVGLWGGADKKSFDKFIGGLNKSKEAAAIQFLKANKIDNPSPTQIAEVIKGMK